MDQPKINMCKDSNILILYLRARKSNIFPFLIYPQVFVLYPIIFDSPKIYRDTLFLFLKKKRLISAPHALGFFILNFYHFTLMFYGDLQYLQLFTIANEHTISILILYHFTLIFYCDLQYPY